ncbi:hypothetical protein ACRWX5_22875, partial [Escherichia coli]
DRTNIMVGYHQTNQKTDTGKTLTRWPVLVDHNKEKIYIKEIELLSVLQTSAFEAAEKQLI